MQHHAESQARADAALLLRARRMAQRSRAAAACLNCKTHKSRCSDYRPCARCKKSGADICMDLPSSAQSAPLAARNSKGSGRSAAIASGPAAHAFLARGGNAQVTMHQPTASAYIDAIQPCEPNPTTLSESPFVRNFYPEYDFFWHHGSDSASKTDTEEQVCHSKTCARLNGVSGAVM